ncbi:MAG: hypothetical protein KGY55_03795, partial [Candidatus Thermoplasmatota archaeon]|nr:hypothetical protein [Candidatus Thermoplasmatota archaeon]
MTAAVSPQRPMISVVVPFHASLDSLEGIRATVDTARLPTETIYIVDTALRSAMPAMREHETVIYI